MRLKFEPPKLRGEGFTGTDLFERERFATGIISLAQNVTDDFVILLDAPWGAGKTYFLKQFQMKAEHEGFPTIYLDAFRHDLSGEAFTALAGEIVAYSEKTSTSLEQSRKKFVQSAAKVGAVVLKGAAGAALSIATAGFLNARSVENLLGEGDVSDALINGVVQTAEKAAEAAVEEMLLKQAAAESTLKMMQDALRDVCSGMLENVGKAEGNPQKRVFFIVDELDRCRPDFALDMIECIKHFFHNEQIIFILSADTNQLLSSISHVYGGKIDAPKYFEKFHDIRIKLPPDISTGSVLKAYGRQIAGSLPDDGSSGNYTQSAVEVLVELAEVYELSLRSFEKIMQRFAVVLAQTGQRHSRVTPAIAILCFSAAQFPEFYEKLRAGNCTFAQFTAIFGEFIGSEKPIHGRWVVSFFEYVLGESDDVAMQNDWRNSLNSFHFHDRTMIVSEIAKQFVDPVSISSSN